VFFVMIEEEEAKGPGSIVGNEDSGSSFNVYTIAKSTCTASIIGVSLGSLTNVTASRIGTFGSIIGSRAVAEARV
jgi:hypothetical protein